MKSKRHPYLSASLLTALLISATTYTAHGMPASSPVDISSATQLIGSWPERPRLAAAQMMAKYGAPQEMSSDHLIWESPGPYKRITLMKTEVPHDFPLPHMDFLQHTVSYRVPAGKADELYEFDGAVTFDRNAGELSARCDLESHNILALNLADEIITGKKSVSAARKAYSLAIADEITDKDQPLLVALQFEPAKGPVGDADKTTIPGSPQRPPMGESVTSSETRSPGDSEVLGLVVALNDNEIGAASVAEKKDIAPEIMAYAKMLHQEHGRNQVETLKLGEKIKVTPIETPAVEQLHLEGAAELATLVPLDGKQFSKAYLEAMVKGHEAALNLIDDKLLTTVQNDRLKQELIETRAHIAHHLAEAQQLQAGNGRLSSTN